MSKYLSLQVSSSETGTRLDIFLSKKTDLSRSQIKKLIEKEKVRVNGQSRRPSYIIKINDLIEVEIPPPEENEIIPQPIPLKIIYQDNDILIINKPSGIIVHPGAGIKKETLVNALLFHFPKIKNVGSEKRPGIVHRLDKDTSGLMVIAKTNNAYFKLQSQFKERTVEKKYLALVKGRMPSKEGKIEIPIGRHIRERKRISVRTTQPKEAITYYRVIEELKDFSYLEIKPITGRTHQIRVHFSSSGHPLVGDKKYGGCNLKIKCPRLFLHASYLSFIHPTLNKKMEFSLPLPLDLINYLKKIKTIS
ncbi:RluA family pseudouridine synthase [Candidatus Aminicenantes bacterium AH-873-B07]|nr:RluA family pseudouridine synthase [Candidatus Aminicenantes bacterium AH-873-B07]